MVSTATAQGEIETVSTETTQKSGQEVCHIYNGFRGNHASLEAATAQGEIETVSTETTQKSGQEVCHIIYSLMSFACDEA